MAVESLIVKTKRDGLLVFSDNAGVNTYEVAFSAGDLSLTVPGPTISNYLDRGRLTAPPSIRYIDDQPISGTFTAYLRDLAMFPIVPGPPATTTLAEIITRSGNCDPTTGNWVSTMGATGEVFTLTLTWTLEGTDHGGVDETCTLNHCAVTGSIAEGDPDTISLTFSSYSLYPTLA